jgi:hypothetical protein
LEKARFQAGPWQNTGRNTANMIDSFSTKGSADVVGTTMRLTLFLTAARPRLALVTRAVDKTSRAV